MSIRPVKKIIESKPTMEGAGVQSAPRLRLRRHQRVRSVPAVRRFPQRQSRAIITPAFRGIRIAASRRSPTCSPATVEHGDSLGNRGTLGAGDVQWMTAGSGIMHQEMPQGDAQGRMHGFQLWANLPSSLKMTAPRYQDIKAADIPGGHRRRRHHGARRLRRLLGQEGPGRRRRRRSALPRHLGAARQAQDLQGRGRPARLRLRLRGLRRVPRRVDSRSAC